MKQPNLGDAYYDEIWEGNMQMMLTLTFFYHLIYQWTNYLLYTGIFNLKVQVGLHQIKIKITTTTTTTTLEYGSGFMRLILHL